MIRPHTVLAAVCALVGIDAVAQAPPTTAVLTREQTIADSGPASRATDVRMSIAVDTALSDTRIAFAVRMPVPSGVTREGGTPVAMPDTPQLDTIVRRRAVAHSEWYSRRLTLHRYGSYVMLPLFAGQYILGSKLLNQKNDLFAGKRTTPVDASLRSTHAVVAGAVGTLFVVNTTTGLWNLFDSRHTEEGRTRRTIHALTMLAADAGFAYTGVIGARATAHGPPDARKHRNMALTSFGISTAGAALMWFGQ